MSDIMGNTYGLCLVLYSGTRDELQAKLRARDDEITRLRSLLKEAGETIQRLYHYHRGCHEDEDVMEPSASDWAVAWEQSRIVLCKIKGEA